MRRILFLTSYVSIFLSPQKTDGTLVNFVYIFDIKYFFCYIIVEIFRLYMKYKKTKLKCIRFSNK